MIIIAIHGFDGPKALVDIQVHGLHIRRTLHCLHRQIGKSQPVFDLIGHLFSRCRNGGFPAPELGLSHHKHNIRIVPGIGQLIEIHFARKIQSASSADKIQVHLDIVIQLGILVRFDIQFRAEYAFQLAFLFPGLGCRLNLFGFRTFRTICCGFFGDGFRRQLVFIDRCVNDLCRVFCCCQCTGSHHAKEQHNTQEHGNKALQIFHNKSLQSSFLGDLFAILRCY